MIYTTSDLPFTDTSLIAPQGPACAFSKLELILLRTAVYGGTRKRRTKREWWIADVDRVKRGAWVGY